VVYWDEPPVFQQFCTENEYCDLVSAEADLHTLARIFAFIGLGRAEKNIPAATPTPAPVWDALRDVLADKIHTAEEFRSRLEKTPLSQFFTVPQPQKPKRSPASLLMIVAGLLLLCGGLPIGLLALWLMRDKQTAEGTGKTGPTPVVSSTGPDTSRPTTVSATMPTKKVDAADLKKLKKDFEAAKTPDKKADLLGQLYQKIASADPKTRDKEGEWIDKLRSQYVDEWVKRYHDSDLKVQKDVTLRYEVAQDLQKLNAELEGLRKKSLPVSNTLNERESQCLEISALRARELGLPR
jgi:hypothetical protein